MSITERLWGSSAAGLAIIMMGSIGGLLIAIQPLVGVGLIIGGIFLYLVIARPQLMLLVMVAALPWENKLHYPSATFSAVKGIGLLVFAGYALQLVADRRTLIRVSGVHKIVAGLGLWILVSLTFSTEPLEGLQKALRWFLFIAFFFLLTQLVDDRTDARRVLRWFVGSVALAGGYGLWKFISEHQQYRVAGPLEDPNDFALLLAATLPLCAYLVSAERGRRWLWSVAFVIIGAATLGTFSRGALVGIAVAVVWGIVSRRIPLWVVTSGAVVGLVVTLLGFTVWAPLLNVALHQKTNIAQNNAEAREVYWAAAIELGTSHLLVGVGPGRYPREAAERVKSSPVPLKEPVTHNSYLEIFSENGLPAVLLFVAYLTAVWMFLRRSAALSAKVGDRDQRRLVTAMQAALIIAAASGMFLSQELSTPYWLLGGLAVVVRRGERGRLDNDLAGDGAATGRRRGQLQPT